MLQQFSSLVFKICRNIISTSYMVFSAQGNKNVHTICRQKILHNHISSFYRTSAVCCIPKTVTQQTCNLGLYLIGDYESAKHVPADPHCPLLNLKASKAKTDVSLFVLSALYHFRASGFIFVNKQTFGNH